MEWRQVGSAPYSVNRAGQVRSDRTGRVLRPMMTGAHGNKRAKVVLCFGGTQQARMVSHLVAEAFIGPRPDRNVVMHKNDNCSDDRAANLKYGTQADNMASAARRGRLASKLTAKQRQEIRRRRSAGEKGRVLAKEFGVSEQHVCCIHKGRK